MPQYFKRFKELFLNLAVVVGYSWIEWYAAGRQEAPGAESQCGIQECHPGEYPNAGTDNCL